MEGSSGPGQKGVRLVKPLTGPCTVEHGPPESLNCLPLQQSVVVGKVKGCKSTVQSGMAFGLTEIGLLRPCQAGRMQGCLELGLVQGHGSRNCFSGCRAIIARAWSLLLNQDRIIQFY
jgi:hypothetical protein